MRERDFTLNTYRILLEALQPHFNCFCGFAEIMSGDKVSYVVLRHDVDRKPDNALAIAKIEAAAGIRASYHFRAGKVSNHPDTVRQIVDLGHEIAYHYEDLSALIQFRKIRDDEFKRELFLEAANSFEKNLEFFRKFYPVAVISMHGSPLSPTDNRLLWKHYDYRAKGIVCEPYFDIDVSDVLYLTDTGRKWNGGKSNLRDRAKFPDPFIENDLYREWKSRPIKGSMMEMTPEGKEFSSQFLVRHTSDLISLANDSKLPSKVIINTHPQRWTDKPLPWAMELILQNIKNQIKGLITRH